jgi:hypothetical protein
VRTIKAFGTDTDLFSPAKKKKDLEYFYPATFSPWKRQSAIAHYGKDLLCLGTVQPDGGNEYQACEKNGVQIMEGYYPIEKIVELYRRAKNVPVPAIHGSERTVLEAMSMNIFPTVNPENVRAKSYVNEFNDSEYERPRDFVVANYSHKVYARQLLKGIEDD